MFKKIGFILLIIIFLFLICVQLDKEFFSRTKLDYAGIIFSDIEKIDLKDDHFNLFLVKDNNNSFNFKPEEKIIIDKRNNLIKKSFVAERDLSKMKNRNLSPVILSKDITKKELESFLNDLDCEKDVLLTHYDFSEYDFYNRSIMNNIENLENFDLECPECLYGVFYFSKKCQKENYEVEKKNVFFKAKGEEVDKNNKSVLFVGDMMFDRGVEYLIQKNKNFNYPFEKIGEYFKNVNFVVGNLEGPIVNHPVFISARSMKFSFNKKIAEVLKKNHFNILSLANNHISNMGRAGLEETKGFLKKNNIDYVGDPVTCSSEHIAVKDNLVFYAVNKTFSFNCEDKEIGLNIKKIKKLYPNKFLIVIPHWGVEYKHIASESQKKLAHLMIDSGADLIIGGHSHVIQNIEKYKDKLIFYSLGNFVFDQYFSKETEEGLMIGLEVNKNKQIYNIFPIKETKAQPCLTKDSILDWLASISSSDLSFDIKQGKIVIYSKDQ